MQPDLAIDLGTSNVRIWVKNKGIVIDEPSVLTIRAEDGEVLAVGREAYEMMGKTSARKRVLCPLNGGHIADMEMAEAMLKAFLKKAVSSSVGMPKAVVSIPSKMTEVEKTAIVNTVSGAGVRRTAVIEEPVAAAMGANLDIGSAHGALIVNMGGGVTDMAVISLGRTAVSRAVRYAGNLMDEEIIRYVKNTYNMLIGKRTAERAKIEAGSVIEGTVPGSYAVKGKCLITGRPIQADMDAEELVAPLKKCVQPIMSKIEEILLETPPELIGDIQTDGILLTGGAAQLRGIDRLIHQATDLKVRVAEEPSLCVVKGCGEALRYMGMSTSPKNGINPLLAQY